MFDKNKILYGNLSVFNTEDSCITPQGGYQNLFFFQPGKDSLGGPMADWQVGANLPDRVFPVIAIGEQGKDIQIILTDVFFFLTSVQFFIIILYRRWAGYRKGDFFDTDREPENTGNNDGFSRPFRYSISTTGQDEPAQGGNLSAVTSGVVQQTTAATTRVSWIVIRCPHTRSPARVNISSDGIPSQDP
jgi:hypothetical protein